MGVQVVWGSTWYSPQFFYAKSIAPKHLNLDIYDLTSSRMKGEFI